MYSEEVLLLKPKVSVMGKPKLEPTGFPLDLCFGPDATNDEVYEAVGRPLVGRAKAGQVGVVFAYGQTGSGKTHTMNGLMDCMIADLFAEGAEGGVAPTVSFSYLEMLGRSVTTRLA